MQGLLAGVLLLAAVAWSRRGTASEQHQQQPVNTTPPGGGSNVQTVAPATPQPDVGKAIGASLGAAGSLVSLGMTVFGGGGTTAATTVATTAVTTTGVAAGAGLGALVPLTVVVAFIAAMLGTRAQEGGKDWQSKFLQLDVVSAQDLNDFELSIAEKWLAAAGYGGLTTKERADPRFTRSAMGSKVNFKGVFRFVSWIPLPASAAASQPDWRKAARITRAMAMDFLKWRATYAYGLNRRFNLVPGALKGDWGVTATKLYSLFDGDPQAGRVQYGDGDYRDPPSFDGRYGAIGGLLNVPSAFGGMTVTPRTNPTEEKPPYLQLVGDGSNEPDAAAYENEPTMKAGARLLGLIGACSLFGRHPGRPGGDGAELNRAVFEAMSAVPEGLTFNGQSITCDPSVFGQAYTLNVNNWRG